MNSRKDQNETAPNRITVATRPNRNPATRMAHMIHHMRMRWMNRSTNAGFNVPSG